MVLGEKKSVKINSLNLTYHNKIKINLENVWLQIACQQTIPPKDYLTAIRVDGFINKLMVHHPGKKNNPLLPPPQKKSVSTSYLTLISFLIYRVAIIAVVTMLVGFVAIKAMVFGKDVEYFSR